MKIQPVILSGGSGTRLWPLSREHYPKQLLELAGERSLLQQTVQRLDDFHLPQGGEPEPPIIVCNEQHRFLVAEQLRELDRPPGDIVLEPFGRNTAPALTLGALASLERGGDDLMLVMAADHVIMDLEAFHGAVVHAGRLAEGGRLATFGVVPDQPHTGYGYIKRGAPVEEPGEPQVAFTIDSFVEKPDRETAEGYLRSGDYFWNSGMFMMRAGVWMEQIELYRPDIAAAARQAYAQGHKDGDFYRLDADAFKACPSDSIDYAVMEKAVGAGPGKAEAVVIPLEAGWSDVGSWPALWDVHDKDLSGNVLKGDTIAYDSSDSMMLAHHRFVAGVGLKDIVVIETPDAVLVAHKDRAQDVKAIVNQLKAKGRYETETHRRVYRPWGSYESVDEGDRFQVKRITVNPGASLSLQMHHHRAEHWIVVHGTARVTRGDEEFLLGEDQSAYIPLGVKHRLENPGTLPLEIIEVQSGSYLGEDDIVRFEDVYGRAE
jgi:mannose-1-phosphate guanylyltransferase/mannose-6-phosphate isomerase